MAFVLAALGFAHGALRLFRKKNPLYYQLLVCAAGCFALQQLSATVSALCGGSAEHITVGLFGFFGCNFFLLSANFGTLDRIVDDGSPANKAAKRLAFLAPAVMAVCLVLVFLVWRSDLFDAVTLMIVLLPALPASYFNLKHLLLPIDDFGFLRATRRCNLAALVLYLVTAAYLLALGSGSTAAANAAVLLMSASVLWLVFSAEGGAKAWKT